MVRELLSQPSSSTSSASNSASASAATAADRAQESGSDDWTENAGLPTLDPCTFKLVRIVLPTTTATFKLTI